MTKQLFNLDLVAVGSGAAVHLVKALTEETPFGADLPNPSPGPRDSRMPSGAPPVPDTDLACIQTWIGDGCPEGLFSPPHEE